MDLFLIEKLAVLRLRQQLVHDDHQQFAIGHGEAVALAPGDWDAIGAYFRERTRQSAMRLRWSILLQIPVAILILMMTARMSWLGALAHRVDTVAPGIVLLAATVTLPLIAFISHNRIVLRTIDDIRATLAARPRIAIAGQPSSRLRHLLEIGAVLWFGPAVFVDIYGSMFPRAFVNTPWTGRHIGWNTVLGGAVLAGLVAFQIAGRLRRREVAPLADGVARRRRLVTDATPPHEG